MEKRKWKDLNGDLLANVFAKAGLESLLFDIPFVCKSWYKATHNPLCWRCFVMPRDRFGSRFEDEGWIKGAEDVDLIKFVGKSSRNSVTTAVVSSYWTKKELFCIAEEFPSLKSLVLPSEKTFYECPLLETPLVATLISKWSNLEWLTLGRGLGMEIILRQINLHSKNFVGLEIEKESTIKRDRALVIVSLLPNLRYLILKKTFVEKESLLIILRGCVKLVHLDVSDCIGFVVDEEIMELASSITKFEYLGSRERTLMDYDEDDMDGFFNNPLFACLFV